MSQRSIFEIQADLCRCMSSATRIEIVHICDLMREVLAEEASHRSKLVEGFQDEHPG